MKLSNAANRTLLAVLAPDLFLLVRGPLVAWSRRFELSSAFPIRIEHESRAEWTISTLFGQSGKLLGSM